MGNKNLFKRIVGWILVIAMTVTGMPFDYLLSKDDEVYADGIEIVEGLEILNDSEEYVTVEYGEEAELSVEIGNAEGKNITYQWYKVYDVNNLEKIEGANEAKYKVFGEKDLHKHYECKIYLDENYQGEVEFSVRLDSGLKIEKHYWADTIFLSYGSKRELNVYAESEIGREISYQWYKRNYHNGYGYEIIDGATDSSYTVVGIEGVAEYYICKISDGIVEDSEEFRVEVDTGLSIVCENNVSINYEEERKLEVLVESELGKEISYKWYKENSNSNYEIIEGATKSRLDIVGDKDVSGQYKCEVSDGIDYVDVYINVELDTGLSIQYEGNIVAEYGKFCELKVYAESELGKKISYQWYKNGDLLIENATNSSLLIPAEETKYECKISDGIVVKTAEFSIELNTGLDIEYESNVTIGAEEEKKLEIIADSKYGKKISYQWYKSEEICGVVSLKDYIELSNRYSYELIEGATESTYKITGEKGLSSSYKCVITDGIIKNEAVFYINLDTMLNINNNESEQVSVIYGEEKELNVIAKSELGKKLSYQWYLKNEEKLIYEEIEGESKCNLLVSGGNIAYRKFLCVVSDGIVEKGVYFDVTVDTALELEYDGDITIEYGKERELTVNAKSSLETEISYQWYKYLDGKSNYELIEGATSSVIKVVGDENTSSRYYCIVSDGISKKEAYFNLEVETGLEVEYYPYPIVEYGKETEIKVEAKSGLGREISYQWYIKGERIKGATSSSCMILGNEDAISYGYICVVSDGIIEKTVHFYPEVDTGLKIEYDSNQVVEYGKEKELIINAESSLGKEISYQWYQIWYSDGVYREEIIEDAINSSYIVKGNEDIANAYSCKVSDGIVVKWPNIHIEVDSGLIVENTDKTEDVYVEYGKKIELNVEAKSELGKKLTYKWYGSCNGKYELIEGETSSSYTIIGDENTHNRFFECVISDGIVYKYKYFFVNVDSGLFIQTQTHINVEYGKERELKIEAVSEIGKEITYQWYECYGGKDEIIEGATDSSYIIIGNENIADSYLCIVTDGIVNKYIRIYPELETGIVFEHGTNITVEVGYKKEEELIVAAESIYGKKLTYQWYKSYNGNSEIIEGATSSSYTIIGDENTANTYYCEVSDGLGVKKVYFYPKIDTGLNVEYQEDVIVEYGKEKELKIDAKSELGKEICYQWYRYKHIGTQLVVEKLEGETSSSYIVKGNEDLVKNYYCIVSDGIVEKSAYFYLELDTGLDIMYDSQVEVEYGKEKELKVLAESSLGKEISYQWYKYNLIDEGSYEYWDYEKIEGATNSSYIVIGNKDLSKQYRCVISDGIVEKNADYFIELDTGLTVEYNSSVTVEYASEKELKVEANSFVKENISYKWYKYDNNRYELIEGEVNSGYKIVGNEKTAKRYCCVISDGFEEYNAYFYVNVDTKFNVEYLSDVVVEYGKEKELKVDAVSGVGRVLSYQWYKNYEKIEGATDSRYIIEGGKENVNSRYTCTVSDGINSYTAYFYVQVDTGFNVEHVSNVAVEYGKKKELKVDAVSALGRTLTYQWYRNSEIIEGETDSVYTVKGDKDNANGRYTCIVSDGINSYTAYFYVLVDTGFKVKHERDVVVEYKKEKELKVEAKTAINNELTYQWYIWGEKIEGATDSSYIIVGEKDMVDYYNSYRCEVSDGVNTYNAYFDIQLDSGLKLEYEENVIVEKEKDKELVVHAESTTGNQISYQWYKRYELIEGATDSSYIIKGTDEVASFYICKVSDGIIEKIIEFDIKTDTGLQVEYEKDVKVVYGDKKELMVHAKSDTGNEITYQWWDENYMIEGATNSSYEIIGCEDVNSYYCCKVSDGITTEWIYFNVELDTGLNVVHQENVTVQYEKNKELSVQAESEIGREVSYRWYKYYAFKDTYRLLEGETASSCAIVGNDYTSNAYKCVISDGIVEKTVYFNVEVKDDIIYGDANGDGNITTQDAVIMKKYLAGYQNLGIDESASDVNCDGKISSADTVLLMKKLAGYDVVLGN